MRITLAFVAGLLLSPTIAFAVQQYEETTIGHVWSWETDGRQDTVNVVVRIPGMDGSRDGATEPEIEVECHAGVDSAHVWMTVQDTRDLAGNLNAAASAALAP